MKNKYQLLSYILIFLAGYCSHFLFSAISPSNMSPTASENVENIAGRNIENNKDNSLDFVRAHKKPIQVDSQSEPNSAKAVIFSAVTTENISADKTEDIATINGELAMLRDYRMQTEINKRNEYLRALGGNTIEALNNNFEREPVDSAWAEEKETLIDNVIGKNEHLSQLPHLDSECRSKQCKFSVLSDDQFYLDKLSGSLEKIIADHETSFSSYSIVVDDKSHTTNIYFDRN